MALIIEYEDVLRLGKLPDPIAAEDITDFIDFLCYIGDKHSVSTGECEQIFFYKPLIVKKDSEHSQFENRYYVLGRTNMDRLLFAVFTLRSDKIRIISARDMTDPEIERYKK